jgi:hypothetical protein
MRKLAESSGWSKAALFVGAVAMAILAVGAVPAAAGSTPARSPVASAASTSPPTTAPTTPSTPATDPASPAPTASPAAVSTAAGAPPPGAPTASLPPLAGVTTATPPRPHMITNFANRLGPRRTAPPGRALTVPVRSDVDGCDRNYGTAGQCVPGTLPAGQTDVCAYLAQRGIKGVRVSGTDVKRLDGNHNGVACD